MRAQKQKVNKLLFDSCSCRSYIRYMSIARSRDEAYGVRMPIVEPKDPRDAVRKSSGVELPVWMWEWLQAEARAAGISRNEFLVEAIRWLIAAQAKEKKNDARK